jgi:hypothetical protein
MEKQVEQHQTWWQKNKRFFIIAEILDGFPIVLYEFSWYSLNRMDISSTDLTTLVYSK